MALTVESSLKAYDRLSDRVRQHRQSSDESILVVEGPSDKVTLGRVLDDVAIFPATGRSDALDESKRLSDWGLERWACVVDRDFDLDQNQTLGGRLFPYLNADLEAMLIGLGVMHGLVDHYGSEAKVSACGGSDKVVDRLCTAALPLALLRERNAEHGWGLPFDHVSLDSKIDRNTLTVDPRSYCSAVRHADCSISLAELILVMEETPPPGQNFRGRDVISVFAVALRKVIATRNTNQANAEMLEIALRSSGEKALSDSNWLSELIDLLNR